MFEKVKRNGFKPQNRRRRFCTKRIDRVIYRVGLWPTIQYSTYMYIAVESNEIKEKKYKATTIKFSILRTRRSLRVKNL